MTADGPGRVIVIGLGNPDRGDDAAGLLVARRLRELSPPGVEVIEWRGDPSCLLDRWTASDTVVVVDAVADGLAAGAVRRLDGAGAIVSASAGSHDLGLGTVLELARALGRAPRRLAVYGVGGAGFSVGAPVSVAVEAAIAAAASRILEELSGEG